jgi:hypothetical protein
VRSPLALGSGANANPWWDPDGRTTRRRRRRLLLELAIAAAALALLMVTAWPRAARAGTTVNLDQWASTDIAWQNGNLNGNNSRYPEGGIVPFRLALEGLKAGNHTIHLNYDVTAGGHKAYDFLATWNITNAAGRICATSGGGISSMCPGMPTASSAAFPSDGYRMDGLTVHGAQLYSAAPRRLTIWGGTIQSVSAPVHSGSPNGNSTADVTVRFRSTGAAVLLAWGGHLAQSAYWNRSIGGSSDGAAMVSGAPWHMRSLQLDGTGNKNQDRSIQPSAIVGELPPLALAPPTPTPRPTLGPPAPRPTAPPATGPGGTPGNPGNPGTPATQAGDPPGVPTVTIPPTSTASLNGDGDRSLEAMVAAILGTSAVALFMLVPILRRRRTR